MKVVKIKIEITSIVYVKKYIISFDEYSLNMARHGLLRIHIGKFGIGTLLR